MPDFMSAAPRPHILSSFTSPENGGIDQLFIFPVGTTSTWPAKQIFGSLVPILAYKFSTLSSSSPKSSLVHLKPKGSKYDIISSN